MTRSMLDGATSSLTLAIGPATRTRAGVLTAEDYSREIELPLADCPQTFDISASDKMMTKGLKELVIL